MRRLTLIATVLFCANIAFASGTTVGNGGNVIVCQDGNGRVSSVQLLDYFELQQNGAALQLNPALRSYPKMLNDLFKRWQKVAPKRMKQYSQWLQDFPNDSGMYAGVQIQPTEDTGVISIPKGCSIQPAAFQRPEVELLPGVKRYTISKDLWDLMPEVQKAGLVLHELIYREAIQAAHTTSFATRYFNGYLSSATPEPVAYSAIVSQMPLLWVEYGGGAVIKVGEIDGNYSQENTFRRATTIDANGYLDGDGEITEILGDISTDKIQIEFTQAPSMTDAKMSFTHKMLSFGKEPYGRDLQIRSLRVSLDRYNLKIVSPFVATHIIFQPDEIDSRLAIALYDNRHLKSVPFLETDPSQSFYVQRDGGVISSIVKVFPGSDGFYISDILGAKFITVSGETWMHKNGHVGYTNQ